MIGSYTSCICQLIVLARSKQNTRLRRKTGGLTWILTWIKRQKRMPILVAAAREPMGSILWVLRNGSVDRFYQCQRDIIKG